MSCKVEGCNQPIYHYNPLVAPLLNFHGTMVKLGNELPDRGKAAGVIKRIGYAVVSPFAYLALAFVALAGLILNGIWEKRHVSQGNAMNQKGADLPGTNSKPDEIEISNMNKTELGKEVQLPKGTFGKEEWEKTFPVTIVEKIPPLPANIYAVLDQEDPCEPGKKLKETCQLFLRPEKVILHDESGDKEITLGFDGVEELAKKATNPDRRTKYTTFDEFRSQMNQIPNAEAGWVLMRKEVIPGSRNKSFEEQKQLLKGGFVVPKLMDAILLNIITYASEGKCLYGKNPWTYTRCQEKFENYQTLVDGFDSSGLSVHNYDFGGDDYGLAGVWKF